MKYGSLKWAFKVMHDLDEGWTELYGPFQKNAKIRPLVGIGRNEDPPIGGLTDEHKARQKAHPVSKELLKSIWR